MPEEGPWLQGSRWARSDGSIGRIRQYPTTPYGHRCKPVTVSEDDRRMPSAWRGRRRHVSCAVYRAVASVHQSSRRGAARGTRGAARRTLHAARSALRRPAPVPRSLDPTRFTSPAPRTPAPRTAPPTLTLACPDSLRTLQCSRWQDHVTRQGTDACVRDSGPRSPHPLHVVRCTYHASPITYHVSRFTGFTFHVSHFTFHVSPFPHPRRSLACPDSLRTLQCPSRVRS